MSLGLNKMRSLCTYHPSSNHLWEGWVGRWDSQETLYCWVYLPM